MHFDNVIVFGAVSYFLCQVISNGFGGHLPPSYGLTLLARPTERSY